MSRNQRGLQHYLEHCFKSVVVNVLVNIESREDVERMAKIGFPRSSHIAPEDWKKVSGTDYRVHMYDRHDPIPIGVKVRLNDPHPIIRVWVIEGFAKMVDKRA